MDVSSKFHFFLGHKFYYWFSSVNFKLTNPFLVKFRENKGVSANPKKCQFEVEKLLIFFGGENFGFLKVSENAKSCQN
jgi:hypothetical protein